MTAASCTPRMIPARGRSATAHSVEMVLGGVRVMSNPATATRGCEVFLAIVTHLPRIRGHAGMGGLEPLPGQGGALGG